MNELNYPIKYAILGIEEQVGWTPGLHEMEREYDICGYIVSKVYVIEENIKYNRDGTYTKEYHVVFPFYCLNDIQKQIPKYNIYYQCLNAINVSQIFDNFDDAKNSANEKNKELRSRCCLPKMFNKDLSLKERILNAQKEFDERIKNYLEFENFIVGETIDMEVTSDEKTKNRIRKL